ncbi:alcohol dehydrogenase [Xylariales sp. PMI_506]|nr:alcohol dehydrogenase [Xylariales sp. PMI_506]
MKAIIIQNHGGPSAFSYEEVSDPIPGPTDILVRIEATALNHVDIEVRNGTSGVEAVQTLPHVPGVDAVGVVCAVGSSTTRWNFGDRVAPHFVLQCRICTNCRAGRENICLDSRILGLTHWGGYAELVCIDEAHLVNIPDGVTLTDAAAGMTPFATAWEALIETAGLRPVETVLVTGGGGGVRSHAVQVAALAGAIVITGVGSMDKVKKVKALGAKEVVNYRKESLVEGVMRVTNNRGVDVVFDGIGGDILQSSIKCLVDGGRVASIGAHAGELVELDMIELFRKHLTIYGCGRSTKEITSKVLGLMQAGKLKAVINSVMPLEKAAKAHEIMESRNFFGRIVLTP